MPYGLRRGLVCAYIVVLNIIPTLANVETNSTTTLANTEANSTTTMNPLELKNVIHQEEDLEEEELIPVFQKVEQQIQHMQELEAVVVQRLDSLKQHVLNEEKESAKRDDTVTTTGLDVSELVDEFEYLQRHLVLVSKELTEAFIDVSGVEKDIRAQQQELDQVREQQQHDNQEHELAAQGGKAFDYESGELLISRLAESRSSKEPVVNNMSISGSPPPMKNRLTSNQLTKLRDMGDPAMLHYDYALLGEFAVLFGISAVGGICAMKIGLPAMVGYVLGGALIGPSGCGFIQHYTAVETISLFGSLFLLFAHGADYNIDLIIRSDAHHRRTRIPKKSIASGLLYLISAIGCIAACVYAWSWVRGLDKP